jgi:CheY-like chemotaxis protein
MVDDAAHAGPITRPGLVERFEERRARVLLIDDEAVIAGALQRVLSHEHDVTLLTSGRNALDALRAGTRFDVILCDLVMPEVSGIDVHAELERIAPDQAQRMIFLTGGAFSGRFQQFLARIANPWFEKPCNLQELRAAIRRAVIAGTGADNRR